MSESKTEKKEEKKVIEAGKQASTESLSVNKCEGTTQESKQGKGMALPEGQCVYIGPELRGVVSRNTIFRQGVPEEVKKGIAGMLSLSRLFIPVEKLPQVNCSMLSVGAYREIFKMAEKEAEKRKKGDK